MKVFVSFAIDYYQCNWILRIERENVFVNCGTYSLNISSLLRQFFWSIKFSQSIYFVGTLLIVIHSHAFKCEYITNNICKSAAAALESGLKWRSLRRFPFGMLDRL